MLQKQTDAAPSTLAGKTFHLAGKFVGHRADEGAALLIAWRGGKVSRTVTASVDYLVLGRGAAAAKKQAETLNRAGAAIEVLDEPTFFARFSPTRAEVIALLTGGKAGLDAWDNLSDEGYGIRWPSLARGPWASPNRVATCRGR
jgi:hypothetical protein